MTEALGFVTTELRGLTHFPSRDAGHGLWRWLTTLARLLPFLFHVIVSKGASSWLSILGTHTFFFQEGGGKINMKINGLNAGKEQKYWKLLFMIQFSGAQSFWRQVERNPALRPESEFKRSLRELKAT